MCWGHLSEQSRFTPLLSPSFQRAELCGQCRPSLQQWCLHLHAQLLSKVLPAPSGSPRPQSTAQEFHRVKAFMIYWALSLCGVNCFLYFYSSLWPPGLTCNYLKGENTVKMETTTSASVGSQLQTLPYTELAYGVKFCTQCSPASTGLWSCRWLIFSALAPQHLMLELHFPPLNSKMSGKGPILSMK